MQNCYGDIIIINGDTNIIIVHRADLGRVDFNLALMPEGIFYFYVKGFSALISLELDKTLLH